MGFPVQYPADLSSWEKWQYEYRFGAFYIFPPAGIVETMDKLRSEFDPRSAAICQAHISLSEPLTGPITEKELDEIRDTVGKIGSFELDYGPLKRFPPYPGVCYDISPKDRFAGLRSAIHGCSAFAESKMTRKEIAPHITIAEFGLTMDDSEGLRKRLEGTVRSGKFVCTEIEYAVPNKDFFFERKLTLPLEQG